MGYGADAIYTRWAIRSLQLWQELFAGIGEPLFHRTGVLWMAREQDPYSLHTLRTLESHRVPFEKLSRSELETRYPQFAFGSVTWAMLEPQSGAIRARRAVQCVVEQAIREGVEHRIDAVVSASGKTRTGGRIQAGTFVFACGPWLPKLFPELLGERIRPTRQEEFFFGVPAAERRFAPPQMPAWIDFGELVYGLPDLENRGFKVGIDRHGAPFDPDSSERVVTAQAISAVRAFLSERFPMLRDAPIVETRVCQYENTSNGDFLVDRHPGADRVWLVGGGSGHGFKHGPALGEYVAAMILGERRPDARFTLATKQAVHKREVF
jgi:glycine/D-amino acid oxidase-like deaminating enzyme